MITLSGQQDTGMMKLVEWYKGPEQFFVFGGYAGTGKSTLASLLQEHIKGKVHYCAYTGKAASILVSKGLEATTLHQAIYIPKEKGQARLKQLEFELSNTKDEEKRKALMKRIYAERENVAQPSFALNLESPLREVDLVVVDEYSMLDQQMIDDLLKIAKKVLFLGDPGQLPPVRGRCPLEPDFFLEEVHRQALDSPILRAATMARLGERIPMEDWGDFKHISVSDTTWEDYKNVDQVIVARNKTRRSMNNRFRKRLGYFDDGREFAPIPVKGDKMICTQNNKDLGIFNGQIGFAAKDAEMIDDCSMSLAFEQYHEVAVWAEHFFNPDAQAEIWHRKELAHFDYGYAITCHKSQGSEFDSVLVFNEGFSRDYNRWLYTACTRAKEKLILVAP